VLLIAGGIIIEAPTMHYNMDESRTKGNLLSCGKRRGCGMVRDAFFPLMVLK